MCGIVGFTGTQNAAPVLLDGLSKLEYRGYDSAGIAVVQGNQIAISKVTGRIQNLREKTDDGRLVPGTTGIGHTRWATHGAPNDINAHPHASNDGKFAVVHNGIIENYMELREELLRKGYRFESETDTEVIVHLIEMYYAGDFRKAVMKASSRLVGSYALGIVCTDTPDTVLAVREASPLILGVGIGENFFASDVTALVAHTRNVIYLEDGELAELTPDSIQVYDCSGHPITKKASRITWDIQAAEKGGYDHFMLKEIMEQPQVINDTILPRIKNGMPDFTEEGISDQVLADCKRICVIACGTAMHAGLVGKSLIQSMIGIHVDVVMASEFMYNDPVVDKDTLVLAISQSGETIDTLEALKFARKCGSPSISIVNVKGASIARASEHVIYTYAGPEIAVASTKAYTTQLAVLYLLTARMAIARNLWDQQQIKSFMSELCRVPSVMEQVLERKEEIHRLAGAILNADDVFMIGRGLDYSILLEGSLKLKEISYIHSEAYASGELKHGTIALITEETPVVAVVTQEKLKSKELSNIREVQSRGARVVLLIKENEELEDDDKFGSVFRLPVMQDPFMVMPVSIVLQLIAYYVSLDKGLDVDKPRNLAKVVTVE